MSDQVELFRQIFRNELSVRQFHCPGRVNLIGEHIDYLGGLVMPAAISLGITGTVAPNSKQTIHVYSVEFDEMATIDISTTSEPRPKHWSNFLIGVIRHLQNEGLEIRGCDIVFGSDLPMGSGLSSSAAMEVLCYHMLYTLFSGQNPDKMKMVRDCQHIENVFIGVNCGIMDQFAVANGKKDHAMLLDCNSLKHDHVPLNLQDHALLIIDSRKPRTLASSAYNQRRAECDDALRVIQKSWNIEQLVHASIEDLTLLADPVLRSRARHAITEQQRVLNSKLALEQNDLAQFGKLMNASHESLKTDYDVSCQELDFIVDHGKGRSECVGIRMTGAGFGGCCVALVNRNKTEDFSTDLKTRYRDRFGLQLEVYFTELTDGVHELTF